MISILIMDKDFDSIKYIRNTIKKSPYDVRAVYASLNSNENVDKIISKNNVNLIFLEARFYGIRTFSIINEFTEKYPLLKIVYFGSVDDTSYIKQFSSVNGIYTYAKPNREYNILKGIELYNNFLNEITEHKSLSDKIYEKTINNRDLFEEKFLINLTNGSIRNIGEILTSMKYFDIDLDSGYRIFVIRIDHYKKIILTLEDEEKNIMISKMKYWVGRTFGQIKHVSFFSSLNQLVVITNSFEDLTKAISMAEILIENLIKELNLKVTIGVGRFYEDISNISLTFNEAVTATNYRFYLGYNTVIPIEYVETNNNISHRITEEKKSKLIFTTVIGELEYALIQIEKVFEDLEKVKELPSKYISKFIHSLVIEVDMQLSAKGIDGDDFYKKNVNYNKIKEINDIDSGKKYLIKFVTDFCEFINNLREMQAEDLYNSAKNFFDEYYYENFSITKVAIGLNVSPDYLDSLFTVYTNSSAYDYVQKKRLEKAKKFLREDDYDDAYIAAQSGFESVMHFRSIFKMYEKKLPNDYRRQYNMGYMDFNKNTFK
ncbi:MAG: helix-turn-helix domain-containing protein [Lachnospirales bacterium]